MSADFLFIVSLNSNITEQITNVSSSIDTKILTAKHNLRDGYIACASTADIESAVAGRIALMGDAQSMVVGVNVQASGQKLGGGIWNGLVFRGDASYYSCLFYGYSGQLRQYVYLNGTKNWYLYTPTSI